MSEQFLWHLFPFSWVKSLLILDFRPAGWSWTAMQRRSLLICPDPGARFLLPASSSSLTWMRHEEHEEGRECVYVCVGGGLIFTGGLLPPFCHLYEIALLFTINHCSHFRILVPVWVSGGAVLHFSWPFFSCKLLFGAVASSARSCSRLITTQETIFPRLR